MIKKTFYILLSGVVILAAAWGIAQYFMFYKNPQKADISEFAVPAGEKSVPIGGTLQFYVDVQLPIGGSIKDLVVDSGKSAVASGEAVVKNIKYGLFTITKRVSVTLRAISPGEDNNAHLSFATEIGTKRFEHKVTFPAFRISEPSVLQIQNLQLAGKEDIVSEKRTARNIIIICAVLLITAIFLTILYFTCLRKKTTPLSEWAKSREELSRLKSDIIESRITPESGFIRLTDLVRGYLEKRFGLPATRRTTPEFIEDISRNGNFVPDDRKPFLKNFLEAADRVKFAMAYPEKELLNRALCNAEALLDATRPNEEDKKDV